MAPQVDNLYFFLIAVTLFFSTLIALLVIVFAVKYRRTHPADVGAPITGSVPLELMWSIIPFGISMVIFAWGANVYFDIYPPPDQTLPWPDQTVPPPDQTVPAPDQPLRRFGCRPESARMQQP